MRSTPSCTAPTLRSAPLPRPFAVAARASSRRAPDDFEREVDDERRGVEEDPRAPERRADREAPLGRAEPGLELADLEDPDSRVHVVRHDRETNVVAGGPLAVRPRDEPLEPFDRRSVAAR